MNALIAGALISDQSLVDKDLIVTAVVYSCISYLNHRFELIRIR